MIMFTIAWWFRFRSSSSGELQANRLVEIKAALPSKFPRLSKRWVWWQVLFCGQRSSKRINKKRVRKRIMWSQDHEKLNPTAARDLFKTSQSRQKRANRQKRWRHLFSLLWFFSLSVKELPKTVGRHWEKIVWAIRDPIPVCTPPWFWAHKHHTLDVAWLWLHSLRYFRPQVGHDCTFDPEFFS